LDSSTRPPSPWSDIKAWSHGPGSFTSPYNELYGVFTMVFAIA